MERLEPIPSPPGSLWREFRHRALPVAAFAAVTAGAVLLWQQRFAAHHALGEAEARRAQVATVEGGLLTRLDVERFQEVRAGEVIAQIEYADTDRVQADLAAIIADLKLTRARLALGEARGEQGLETLRIRWLEARAELARERALLVQARADLGRNESLQADGVVSAAAVDLSRATYEATAAAVAERERLVAGLQEVLPRLESDDRGLQEDTLQLIEEAITAQETLLRRAASASLRAPMDGVVSHLFHHRGERVPRGAVIAVITARQPEHIIGYLRAPAAVRPQPGMAVHIRGFGPDRQTWESTVIRVGADLQVLGAPVQNFAGAAGALEQQWSQMFPGLLGPGVMRGLPFLVAIPPGMNLLPGEPVNLTLAP